MHIVISTHMYTYIYIYIHTCTYIHIDILCIHTYRTKKLRHVWHRSAASEELLAIAELLPIWMKELERNYKHYTASMKVYRGPSIAGGVAERTAHNHMWSHDHGSLARVRPEVPTPAAGFGMKMWPARSHSAGPME